MDEAYMRRAIDLAGGPRLGQPQPLVGAVL